MPYRRRYRRSSRGTRRVGRKTYRNKRMIDGTGPLTTAERLIKAGASTHKVVRSIAKSVGIITSMINTEKKYVDKDQATPLGIGPPSGLYLSTWFTGMPQGDTDSQRNGNQILGNSFSLRYILNWNDTSTEPLQTVRVVILCDKSDHPGTSTLPLASEVLENTNNVLSPINRDFSKRFVILKSAIYNLSSQNPNISDKVFIKTPWHLFYRGATSNYSDAAENHIYMYVFSNVTDGLDPSISWYSRFNYYDN